ncbi:MAG: hypothetical protein NAG76_04160 [Candidatus Pristimantibacillus lignocellulolyticus]|uniref:Spore coat protein B n=1 Tax=Candidatus Pristimantibacillus lignocellulolyticus TaxID=2994561 RepID=A0A9J6ZH43_9BACL|nr:MAG: hypothetical protein NAG76_04160 [Candidatus Pristimantibacillus lignocellulolyticus]
MAEYNLSSLIGQKIQLDRGGPESRVGLVLAVGDDFLVLSTVNEGIVYYYVDHIKSITLVKSDSSQDVIKPITRVNYVSTGTMKNVFESMKYNRIQINRGGPESVKGVLTEIYDDYITIVLKDEVLLILFSHIKSCSFSVQDRSDANNEESTQENKQDSKNENENKKKDNNSNKRKSRNRRYRSKK